MKGEVIVESFVVSLFIDLFKKVIDSKIPKWKEQLEYKKFLKDIETWCNNFMQSNELTIVSSSYFYDYINHFNFIGHVIDFIGCPKGVSEKDFLNENYKDAIKYLKQKKPVGIDDSRAVK